MKVTKMQTRAFWKGEFRIDGLVEDQGITYKVSLENKGAASTATLVLVQMGILIKRCVLMKRLCTSTIWPRPRRLTSSRFPLHPRSAR